MMAADMSIDIVRIAEAHVAGFHACLDAVAREKRYLAQLEAPPLDRTLAFVRDNIAKDAAQSVALDGDRVVGWCDVLPAWPAALQHRGGLGMGVLAAYRGRGIGQRLMAATLAHARSKGLTRVELEVRADNASAIRLYERMGFAHEGRKRNGNRLDGMYFDSLTMGLVWTE
jgi:ribosomal protein S18 acetylase RimI-like enzyme